MVEGRGASRAMYRHSASRIETAHIGENRTPGNLIHPILSFTAEAIRWVAKIALCRLHRHVPQEELDLFQFTAGGAAQAGTGPAPGRGLVQVVVSGMRRRSGSSPSSAARRRRTPDTTERTYGE